MRGSVLSVRIRDAEVRHGDRKGERIRRLLERAAHDRAVHSLRRDRLGPREELLIERPCHERHLPHERLGVESLAQLLKDNGRGMLGIWLHPSVRSTVHP